MKFDNTAGINSRVKKLNVRQVKRIRKLYARGKYGKANAAKFGITPAQYNKIGRRQAWETV